jgi:hypothetical protein
MKKTFARQWYELRTWHFSNADQQLLTETYLEKAYLPALNRAGLKPIGVFSETQAQGTARLFLLIPYPDLETFAGLDTRLAADTAYLSAAEPYRDAPAASPAYERIESFLLQAFKNMPAIEAPEKKQRLFELRCYESPSEAAGQKKIAMFNDAGEIGIFKRIGARPVFFGETIIGERRPNLIYMLCFDNMDDHDARWKAFGSDPRWQELKAMDEYSDARLITRITRTFLTPTDYSQI